MDSLEVYHEQRMTAKEQFTRGLAKLAAMSPEQRATTLKKANLPESKFLQMIEGQREEVEGKEPEIQRANISSLPFAAFIPLLIKKPLEALTLLGIGSGASTIAEVLGASESVQTAADIIASITAIATGVPEGTDRLISLVGEEKAGKIIEETQNLAQKTIDEVTKPLEKITGGIEKPPVEWDIPPSFEDLTKVQRGSLSEETQDAISKLPEDIEDHDLRNMRSGFIKPEIHQQLLDAQQFRVNRLAQLLNIFKNAAPEEKKLIAGQISTEFTKYAQLQVMRVEEITKGGKQLTKLAKHPMSDNDLEALHNYIRNVDFPETLDKMMKMTRFSYRAQMYVKGALKGYTPFRTQMNSLLWSPALWKHKGVTDLAWLPVSRATRSIGLGITKGDLTLAHKTFFAAMTTMARTLPEAFRMGRASIKSGLPEFEMELGVEHPMVFAQELANSEPEAAHHYLASFFGMGKLIITGEDQFAKTLSYRMEEQFQALMDAINEVDGKVEGAEKFKAAMEIADQNLAEHPELYHEKALEEAYKQSFTNKTWFSKWVQAGIKQGHLRNLFPFVNTPVNLYMQGLQISPLGFFNPEIYRGEGLERSVPIAKAVLGTMLGAWTCHEVLKGNITGGGPRDPRRADVWARTHQKYHAFGHNYAGYGPFSTSMALAADACEIYSMAKDGDKYTVIDAVTKVLAGQLTTAPLLAEVSRFMDAGESVVRAKALGEKVPDPVTNFLANLAGEFVPGPIKTFSQITDPNLHAARGIVDKAIERTPWGVTLPVKHYWDGTPRHLIPGADPDTSPTKLEVMRSLIDPTYDDNIMKSDHVDDTLNKLGVEFRRIPEQIGSKDVAVNLTPEQQSEWEEYSGKGLKVQQGDKEVDQRGYLSGILISRKFDFSTATSKEKEMMKTQLEGAHNAFVKYGEFHIRRKYGLDEQIQNKMREKQGVPTQSQQPTETPTETQPPMSVGGVRG